MTKEDVLDRLRKALTGRTQGQFAEEHGFSATLVSDTLGNRIDPPPKVLAALGIEKVVTYRKKATANAG